MKMEGAGDLVNGRGSQPPSPKEIGCEFVRQYYTMLSERPQDVFRFYSHESFFMHQTEEPIQGQQKIQKAIESLQFVECKARIFTVTGSATLNNGLVIQVCGELSMRDSAARRFLQTFVLCPQTPKKYYVHNDIFQWLDMAFNDNMNTTSQLGENPARVPQPMINHQPSPAQLHHPTTFASPNKLNGHVSSNEQQSNMVQPSYEDGPGEQNQHSSDETHELSNGSPPMEEPESGHEADDEGAGGEVGIKTDEESDVAMQTPVEQGPKSWAKLVGGNTTAPNRGVPLREAVAPTRGPVVRATSVPITGDEPTAMNNMGDQARRLYLGSIMRNTIPEAGDQTLPEREIQAEFEMHLPRRALDFGENNKYAYAFIVMKTNEGAANAYKACRQDRGVRYIKVKIDSFAFDGEATLSEQKQSGTGPPMRGNTTGYMGGGPMRGGGRGGGMMMPRGGRGMMQARGGFQPRGGGGGPPPMPPPSRGHV